MGWTNPWVLAGLIGGVALLVVFCFVENRGDRPDVPHAAVPDPRRSAPATSPGLLASIGRGGLQFMLIIWLQGIWLPLHGYSYESTPLWAGIYLLPLTVGFLVAGPLSGYLSDRFGARPFAVGGLLLVTATFVALLLLPVDFPYPLFAALIALNGIGTGLFSAPNAADHEQRAGPAARRGLGDAGHVLQRRHVAVDRHLLLADGRRAGGVAAARR